MFEKEITRDDGEVIYLVTGIQAQAGFEKSYEQSISVGEVVLVGSGVNDIKAGDLVILDYMVDLLPEIIVSKNEQEKIVCLDLTTEFYDKKVFVDANRRTPHPTIIADKGQMKKATLLIAYVRDGVINPVWPYVFLEHVPPPSEFQVDGSGSFFTLIEEEQMVERKVLLVNKNTDFKAGEVILCDSDHIFPRELNGKKFDVIFQTDIAAIRVA